MEVWAAWGGEAVVPESPPDFQTYWPQVSFLEIPLYLSRVGFSECEGNPHAPDSLAGVR